jgi:hypothetical protein
MAATSVSAKTCMTCARDAREARAEMDGELRRLSTAIQQWRDGSADDLAGLRERRQRLWDLRAIGGRDPAAVSP